MGELVDHLQDPEEAEEALSLCDLPINTNDYSNNNNNIQDSSKQTRRSSSEPSEFFEFFNDLNSEMCSAEDIIICGKLVPFKEQPLSTPSPKTTIIEDKKQNMFRKRSESLSGLQSSVTRSNSTKTSLMRNSKSLDYRKLHKSSSSMISPAPEIERNSSIKSVGKSDILAKKVSKPRWFVLMFGMVKIPSEMELSDIKNRQVRRNPSTMFPPVDVTAGRKLPVNRSSGKGSWRLLSALSCKDDASVAVTASFGCMSQV